MCHDVCRVLCCAVTCCGSGIWAVWASGFDLSLGMGLWVLSTMQSSILSACGCMVWQDTGEEDKDPKSQVAEAEPAEHKETKQNEDQCSVQSLTAVCQCGSRLMCE